jgi:hypothetical protein
VRKLKRGISKCSASPALGTLAQLAALFLAACANDPKSQCDWWGECGALRQQQLKSEFDHWIGSPISRYALQHGPPNATFDVGPNKRAFQWRLTGQSPGMAVPIGGVIMYRAPQEQVCTISLTATGFKASQSLADWIIDGYAWNGNC